MCPKDKLSRLSGSDYRCFTLCPEHPAPGPEAGSVQERWMVTDESMMKKHDREIGGEANSVAKKQEVKR